MATKGGHIDFMFLGPPYLAVRSATVLTSISTPKVDKNRTLDCTSINLRHTYILHLFFNLYEKVMLRLNDLRRYAERSKARKFYDMGGEKYINCVTDNTLSQSMSSKCKFTFKNR